LVELGNGQMIEIYRQDIQTIKSDVKLEDSTVEIRNDRIKYNLTNTAYRLDKNKWLYRTTLAVTHNFHYGISNRVMVGAGFDFLSLFLGEPYFNVSSKIKVFESAKTSLSISYNAFIPAVINDLPEFELPFVGIVNPAVTYGDNRNHLTVGAGFVQVENDFSDIPLILLGGKKYMTEKLALMLDGFFVTVDGDTFYNANFGLTIRSKRHSWNLFFSLIGLDEELAFSIIPIGNYNLEIN